MTLRVDDDVLNDAADASVDNVDEGTTELNGVVEFYTGSPPATFGDPPGAILLATVDLQDPAFGDAGAGANDAGVASAAGVPLDTTGVDDGTVGWARILDRDEVTRWDEDDVGTSGNAITLNTTTVSTGVDFSLTSYDFSAAP